MKVTLYMTLTASGQLTQAGVDFNIPPEVFQDAQQHVAEAGNLVVGRRTFEQMRGHRAGGQFGAELVVVSRGLDCAEGASVAASPKEALALLESKGFRTVLLGGGAALYSAFLDEGLVDELYLNVAPLILGDGLRLAFGSRSQTRLRSLGATSLGPDLVQLHYGADR